jgi:hypothetical protein
MQKLLQYINALVGDSPRLRRNSRQWRLARCDLAFVGVWGTTEKDLEHTMEKLEATQQDSDRLRRVHNILIEYRDADKFQRERIAVHYQHAFVPSEYHSNKAKEWRDVPRDRRLQLAADCQG